MFRFLIQTDTRKNYMPENVHDWTPSQPEPIIRPSQIYIVKTTLLLVFREAQWSGKVLFRDDVQKYCWKSQLFVQHLPKKFNILNCTKFVLCLPEYGFLNFTLLRSVSCVQYTISCVQCTTYVFCKVHYVLFALCSVQCPVYSVLCTVSNVQCPVYSVLCTVSSVLCTVSCV